MGKIKERKQFSLFSCGFFKKASFLIFAFLLFFPLTFFSVGQEGGEENAVSGQAQSYIIELEKAPLAEKKSALERSFFAFQEVEDGLELYRRELEQNKREVKNRIKEALDTEKEFFRAEDFSTGTEFNYLLNGFVIDNLFEKEAKDLEKVEGVKKVWENKIVEVMLSDSVPLIQGDIPAGELDEDGNDCSISKKDCLTGEGVTIAIIDTGVDYTHADFGECTQEEFLEGDCEKVIGGYDFVTCEKFIPGGCAQPKEEDNDPMDKQGHGTHVASIAAGDGETVKGVAPGAEILAYRVLNTQGRGYLSWVVKGIEEAVADGADILNLSLGAPGDPDDLLSVAVDNAVAEGVVAVVSAGNSGPGDETITSPGTARKAITVGATDKSDLLASFSSRGPVKWNGKEIMKPDIVAPGVSITAAKLEEGHTSKSGTSMSAPHVAGAAALLKENDPTRTPEEIKDILKNGADNLEYEEKEQGEGRVNLQKTLRLETEYTLGITIEDGDSGIGEVSADPDQANYVYGTKVELTASSTDGEWAFSHWSGDLDGSDNPKTVVMDDDKAVTAHFIRDAHTISISIDGEGTVTKDPEKSFYPPDDSLELTAVAKLGWVFSHWSGDLDGSDNPKTVVMDDDKAVTAHFIEEEYTLTVPIEDGDSGIGEVSADPDQANYVYGTKVELTASSTDGEWDFSHWSGDLTGSANPGVVTMDDDKTVTAHFIEGGHALSINISEGGSVTKDPDKAVYPEEEVTVTANPNFGWTFSHWSGDLEGDENPETLVIGENKEITAHFEEEIVFFYKLELNAFPSEGGSVSGEGHYLKDEVVEITASTNTGYEFTEWTGDTDYIDNAESITANVTIPAKDIALTANFELKEYTLSISIDGGGSVSRDPEKSFYQHGTEVSLTASPSSGWKFSEWSGDLKGSTNPNVITIDENKTVTAVFERVATGGSGGSGGGGGRDRDSDDPDSEEEEDEKEEVVATGTERTLKELSARQAKIREIKRLTEVLLEAARRKENKGIQDALSAVLERAISIEETVEKEIREREEKKEKIVFRKGRVIAIRAVVERLLPVAKKEEKEGAERTLSLILQKAEDIEQRIEREIATL